jgi:uncharacterized membrane protein YeaQ/YmgE (transglycosylase-associated protein family)
MGDHPDGRSGRFARRFWSDAREAAAMMVEVWLGCGILAALVAWSAHPPGYPGGLATALVAGLCGGFLGGAFVILTAGRHGALPAMSVFGASVGAIVLLDLAERTSGSAESPPRRLPMAWLWSWACLIAPLLLAVLIGIALGARAHSPPLGLLIGIAAMPLLYWQRDRGVIGGRRWRE